MRVTVDLREWIAYSLGPPGPIGLLLDHTPTVDANPDESVYDLLDRTLAVATSKVPEEFRHDLGLLNPFRSTHELWILGWPAEVRFIDRSIHLIDSIRDLAPTSDSITLILRPRDDIRKKSDSLRESSKRFADAIGLRPTLDGLYTGVVDKIIEVLTDERLTPRFREALDLLDDFRRDGGPPSSSDLGLTKDLLDAHKLGDDRVERALHILKDLRKSVGEHLADTVIWIALTTVETILGRHEITAYNDFSIKAGAQCVEHYWVPFSYPTQIWEEIAKSEGPMFLSEIGSRLWLFSILRRRMERTKGMLAQGCTVDSLVGKSLSLSPPTFLKPDEILNWWFEKESVALRYYLIGIFSFPESFLGLLKGEDVKNYKTEVGKMLGLAKDAPKKLLQQWLRVDEASEIRLTDVLRRVFDKIPGGLKVVFEMSDPKEFIRVQREIQRADDEQPITGLLFLYYELRNKLVHGVGFNPRGIGTLVFQHKGRGQNEQIYVVDYDTLALAYHLLPAVVGQLYKAYKGQQIS